MSFKMKYNYCTLFDSKYLSRGLAMYFSLERYSKNFHIYIFAFDSVCYDELKRLNLKNASIIPLSDFEDERLLTIKTERTRQEYCWTCASSTIKYSIEKFNLDECTYLDSDIFFLNDPSPLHNELKNKSVLITDHRYTPIYDQSLKSGRYCVQFITFKNDVVGKKILNDWVDKCLEWCYARFEGGKFGDQKYLDEWADNFPNSVHELIHIGGGVAPWNIQQYEIYETEGSIELVEKSSNRKENLIFFHFHDFKIDQDGVWNFGTGPEGYRIPEDALRVIYKKYLETLFALRAIIDTNVKTDLPSVPKEIGKDEFDEIFLPTLNDYTTRHFIRNLYTYSLEQDKYFLTDEKNLVNEQVFKTFLDNGFHLNFYKYSYLGLNSIFKEHSKKKDALIEKQDAEQKEKDALIEKQDAAQKEKDALLLAQDAAQKEKDALIHKHHKFAHELMDELKKRNIQFTTQWPSE
jgi:hypothetical protein